MKNARKNMPRIKRTGVCRGIKITDVCRVMSRSSKERVRQKELKRRKSLRRRHIVEAIIAGLLAVATGLVALKIGGTV